MTHTPIVIVGAGGFGREVHDVLEAINATGEPAYEAVGFLDDGPVSKELLDERGMQLLGPIQALEHLPADVQYVVAIGDGRLRRRIDLWATSLERIAPPLVHPRATLGRHGVSLSPGAVVCAGSIITTNVHIGRHVHVNLGVTVGHDAVIGDYVTINPNVSISGAAILEDAVSMGTGSCIIQGRRVGAETVVGAGAVVVHDIEPGVTAVGVPARSASRPTGS